MQQVAYSGAAAPPLNPPLPTKKWYLEKKVVIPAFLFITRPLITRVIFPRAVSLFMEASLSIKFLTVAVGFIGSYYLIPPLLQKGRLTLVNFYAKNNWDSALGTRIEWLKEAAGKGDKEAQYKLGNFYFTGTFVARNKRSAEINWEDAAKQGHIGAKTKLTENFPGRVLKKEVTQAFFHSVSQEAHPEDKNAKFHIALCHYEGKGTPRSLEKALPLFQVLDRLGHFESSYYLGRCHLEAVPPNPELAFEAFIRSIANEHPYLAEAEWEIAHCHRDGKGTKIDLASARQIFTHLAEKKNPKFNHLVHYELGWFARVERGPFNENILLNLMTGTMSVLGFPNIGRLPIYQSKESEHFEIAAREGYSPARLELARYYKPKDHAEYFRHLKMAAEMGNPHACYEYAQTLQEKEPYLIRAADQEYPKAAYQLYQITRNKTWLKRAAEYGHPEAQYLHAIDFENERIFPKMLEYLEKSAERGFEGAQRKLEGLYFRGDHVGRNEERANEWKQRREAIHHFHHNYQDRHELSLLENLALRGHGESAYIVAHHYWLGIDVPRDQKKGMEWLQKAVHFGDKNAKKWLAYCHMKGEGVELNLHKAKELLG